MTPRRPARRLTTGRTPDAPANSEHSTTGDDSGHRLKHGMISSAASSVATIAAGLILLPLIIDRIGAGRYGVWLLLSTFATYLYQADLGLGAVSCTS